MPRKTLAAVVLTNAAATAVAVYPVAHSWPVALAAGAFAAILVRIGVALSVPPTPLLVAERSVRQGVGAGRPV